MPLALDRLLAGFNISAPAIPLSDMQLDTRLLKQGSIFLALKGHAVDGRLLCNKLSNQGLRPFYSIIAMALLLQR